MKFIVLTVDNKGTRRAIRVCDIRSVTVVDGATGCWIEYVGVDGTFEVVESFEHVMTQLRVA